MGFAFPKTPKKFLFLGYSEKSAEDIDIL